MVFKTRSSGIEGQDLFMSPRSKFKSDISNHDKLQLASVRTKSPSKMLNFQAWSFIFVRNK